MDIGEGVKKPGYYIQRSSGLFPAPLPRHLITERVLNVFKFLGSLLAKCLQVRINSDCGVQQFDVYKKVFLVCSRRKLVVIPNLLPMEVAIGRYVLPINYCM